MDRVGAAEMPPNFKYLDVLRRGRPRHDRDDRFSIRHPKMDPAKRAKLFAPFDALRGFDFAILTEQTRHLDQREGNRAGDPLPGPLE